MTPEGPRIPTHYTHRQLATMIGSSRETVTRDVYQTAESRGRGIEAQDVYVKTFSIGTGRRREP
jgi:hypothetical protein